MSDMVEARQTIIRFLLGEMSDRERAVFEDESLRDEDLFHRIAECDNDLIDLYAIGAFSASEQRRLEAAFLQTPERRKRLMFSQALMSCPAQTSPVSQQNVAPIDLSPLPWSRAVSARLAIGAAFCVALTVTCMWLLIANRSLKTEIQELHEHDQTVSQKAAGLQKQIDDMSKRLEASSQVPNGLRHAVFFTLSTDALRGSGKISELAISPATSFVEFHVVFPRDAFSTYRVLIESANGRHIWQGNASTSKDPDGLTSELIFEVPARVLGAGDYVLRVTAKGGKETEDVAGYAFKVAHY